MSHVVCRERGLPMPPHVNKKKKKRLASAFRQTDIECSRPASTDECSSALLCAPPTLCPCSRDPLSTLPLFPDPGQVTPSPFPNSPVSSWHNPARATTNSTSALPPMHTPPHIPSIAGPLSLTHLATRITQPIGSVFRMSLPPLLQASSHRGRLNVEIVLHARATICTESHCLELDRQTHGLDRTRDEESDTHLRATTTRCPSELRCGGSNGDHHNGHLEGIRYRVSQCGSERPQSQQSFGRSNLCFMGNRGTVIHASRDGTHERV